MTNIKAVGIQNSQQSTPPPPRCSAPGESTVMILANSINVHMLIIHTNFQVCSTPGSLEEV